MTAGTEASRKFPWLRIGAEGLAIVVSILLAFAIDAWHDGVVERRLAAQYDQRIETELRGVRNDLELLARVLNRAMEYGDEAAGFFDGGSEPVNKDRLVMALFNMGRDYADPFDLSTYQDLLSSGRLGLISDIEKRAAIQRAYELIPRVEQARYPYLDEYVLHVRAWIPQSMVRQIVGVEACSNIAAEKWNCPTIHFDEASADAVIRGLRTDEALLAYRTRVQGLASAANVTAFVTSQVDDALKYFE